MKTILVTGAAGYIGRHVVKKALDMGYRVIASDFAFKRPFGFDRDGHHARSRLLGGCH